MDAFDFMLTCPLRCRLMSSCQLSGSQILAVGESLDCYPATSWNLSLHFALDICVGPPGWPGILTTVSAQRCLQGHWSTVWSMLQLLE